MQPTPTLTSRAAPVDHTQLPDTDGAIGQNFQEYPQSELLTGSLLPRLHQLYPDGQFAIGQDNGIYWRQTKQPLEGCKTPDWFLVPGVPPMLDGQCRRSYVLWQESVRPLVVIEYVSGNGAEERDATPRTGKFWVYEQAIAAGYYAIYEVTKPGVELLRLSGGRYAPVDANPAGRYPIPELGVELGIWQGAFRGMDLPWLRVWDTATGALLPSADERVEAEKERAEAERERADAEKERAENAETLLDDFRTQAQEESERAEKERKRAEEAEQQAKLAKQQAASAQLDYQKLTEKLRAAGIDPNAV